MKKSGAYETVIVSANAEVRFLSPTCAANPSVFRTAAWKAKNRYTYGFVAQVSLPIAVFFSIS